MRRTLMILLPLSILLIGVLGAGAMYLTRPEPETREPQVPLPLVRVEEARLQDVQLTVRSQGTVSPRTESALVPEVSGRVIEVSPSFVSGGFFEAGDVLLRIDPHDYEQAVVEAESGVARAQLRLAREEAEAEVAIREWNELDGGEAPPLTRHDPQLADARAALNGAEALLSRARRNLERTEIRAPYAGRLRQKLVDVGQFVSPGMQLAKVYAVDYAEIRLPISDDELAYLDLPLDYRGEDARQSGPRVILRSNFAGKVHEWEGSIVRTEGEIDPRSRLVHAVARVRDPYSRGDDPERPPLAVGLYVRAEILGKLARDVVVLPRAALRGRDQVLVVDDDDRLRFRTVDILRATDREVIVRSGVGQGERVCLSPLAAVTDGMKVRIQLPSESQPPPSGSQGIKLTPPSGTADGSRSTEASRS